MPTGRLRRGEPTVDRKLFLGRLRAARHARQITPIAQDVGQELLRYADRGGVCWPSHATLAEGIGCCERSVARAVASLKALGLLDWTQRKARWNRATSNLYRLLVPDVLPPNPIKNITFRGSTVKMSAGPLSPEKEAAAIRLAALIGSSTEALKRNLGVPVTPGAS